MAIIPKQLGTHYLDPYEWPALMEKFERHIPVPYDDKSKKHIATIGIGVNLRERNYLALVLKKLGVFDAICKRERACYAVVGEAIEECRLTVHDSHFDNNPIDLPLNVLFGKYKMVTNEVKDLVYGLYGKTPTPVDPEVQKKVLKGYKRGETPVTGRAADYLEPELDQVRESIGDLAKDDYDLLICALYPTTGEQYLKWKYGLEERPAEVKPKTLGISGKRMRPWQRPLNRCVRVCKSI